jgi:hypothetical protein
MQSMIMTTGPSPSIRRQRNDPAPRWAPDPVHGREAPGQRAIRGTPDRFGPLSRHQLPDLIIGYTGIVEWNLDHSDIDTKPV